MCGHIRLRLGLDFFFGFSCPSLCLYKDEETRIVMLFLKGSKTFPDAGVTGSRRDTEKDCLIFFRKKIPLTERN